MRRAAIYARFSTDLQAERSVEDQTALCRDFARSQGLEVVAAYHDRARSGATTHGREGLSRLLEGAKAGAFSVVIVEALDRLSRDQEDLAGLHKRLTFAGVEILAVHDGRADAIQVGIRGLVSSLFLTDLKHKIRRGMSGRVRDGLSAGGRAYGYRPTPGEPGRLTIREDEAEVVRRIFRDYAAGVGAREIASRLNEEGIPAPRGARWAQSVIIGNARRGHGLVRNPIYSGRIVWNKVHMLRDPETGRRVSRPNPLEVWQTAQAPELAIIPPDLWEATQARVAASASGPQGRKRDRRGRLLSGLLRCGRCGGGVVIHDRDGPTIRVRCARARVRACTNVRSYNLQAIEAAVVEGIAAALRRPEGMRAWIEDMQAERRADSKARARLEREAEAARAKVRRMAKMLVEGRVPEDFFDAEMPAARAELAALEARLAEAPEAHVVVLHPAAVASYAEALDGLARDLAAIRPDDQPELAAAFRSLVEEVRLVDGPGREVICEVTGPLTPLVAQSGGFVVAGERLAQVPRFRWGSFLAEKIKKHA